jgi:hypothetical protein
MALRILSLAALLATTALAKTDLGGCTYITSVVTVSGRPDIGTYQTRVWYDPDTREICELLDCGGGRAPPKTDVPGCGLYEGTETYSPRFLPESTSSSAVPAETDGADAGETSLDTGAVTTPAPTGSAAEPEASGSADEEEGAGEGQDAGSGAAAMGVSVLGGLAAILAGLI